jgi:hypothetical protein
LFLFLIITKLKLGFLDFREVNVSIKYVEFISVFGRNYKKMKQEKIDKIQ